MIYIVNGSVILQVIFNIELPLIACLAALVVLETEKELPRDRFASALIKELKSFRSLIKS